MKYAENEKISQKQLFSQASVSMLGLSLMAVPEFMGFSLKAMIPGVILAGFFFWVQSISFVRICPCYARLCTSFGNGAGKVLGLIYVSYVWLSQVVLLKLIADLADYYFVERIDKGWLILLTGIVCAVGMYQNVEKRARIGEMILPGILFFILFMLILAFRDFSFQEVLRESERKMTTREVAEAFYKIVCLFLPVYFFPFILNQTKKNTSAKKSMNGSTCLNLGILLLAFLLLLGLLGRKGYAHKKYPMIDLMSGVNFPGDFFQRSDLFWSGSLIFGLFYLCGSVFFYQHEILKRCRLEKGTLVMDASAVLFAVFAEKFGFSFAVYRTLVWYGYGIAFPVLTLLAGIWYKRKKMGRRGESG